MKKLKIGDRVKIRSTGKRGMVVFHYSALPHNYSVAHDSGGEETCEANNLIRLRKKKKTKTHVITKQQLARLWNEYLWNNSYSTSLSATESKVFEKICKELGV